MIEIEVHIINVDSTVDYYLLLDKEFTVPEILINKLQKISNENKRNISAAAHYFLFKNVKNIELINSYSVSSSGKPYFSNSDLFFNISHTNDLVGIAICKYHEIGFDIQFPRKVYPGLLKKVMHSKELENNDINNPDFFFKAWTKKEAIVKLIGKGIVSGLSNINSLVQEGSLNGVSYFVDNIELEHSTFEQNNNEQVCYAAIACEVPFIVNVNIL